MQCAQTARPPPHDSRLDQQLRFAAQQKWPLPALSPRRCAIAVLLSALLLAALDTLGIIS